MTLLSPVSWWYNWKVTANHDLPPGDYCTCSTGSCGPQPGDKNFVPMVWNIKLMQEDPVDDRYPILLGFNEPNHADQADIEPEVAAAAWIELQNLYPDKVLSLLLCHLSSFSYLLADPGQSSPCRWKYQLVRSVL